MCVPRNEDTTLFRTQLCPNDVLIIGLSCNYPFFSFGLLTVLRNMIVFSMILVEAEGGGERGEEGERGTR